jgi:hypothetical protein
MSDEGPSPSAVPAPQHVEPSLRFEWPHSVRFLKTDDFEDAGTRDRLDRLTESLNDVRRSRQLAEYVEDAKPLTDTALQSSSNIYRRLPEGQWIRCLHLDKATSYDDVIVGHFTLETLKRPPEYTALSYTWADEDGDASLSSSIRIVKPPESHDVSHTLLRVTRNCELALRRLRNAHAIVWIDAICINQSDDVERSRQVAVMASIYANASHVFIYVGENRLGSDDDGEALLSMLSGANIKHALDFTNREAGPWEYTPIRMLRLFLQRPYFRRRWIVQEVISGADRASVTCGQETIPLRYFLASHVEHEEAKHVTASSHVVKKRAVRSRITSLLPSWLSAALRNRQAKIGSVIDFLELLLRARDSRCSDLRDRVFALQGLLQESLAAELTPDYSRSAEEILVGFAFWLASRLGPKSVLSFHQGQPMTTGESVNEENDLLIPSWVPRWDTNTKRRDLRATLDCVLSHLPRGYRPITSARGPPTHARHPAENGDFDISDLRASSPRFHESGALILRCERLTSIAPSANAAVQEIAPCQEGDEINLIGSSDMQHVVSVEMNTSNPTVNDSSSSLAHALLLFQEDIHLDAADRHLYDRANIAAGDCIVQPLGWDHQYQLRPQATGTSFTLVRPCILVIPVIEDEGSLHTMAPAHSDFLCFREPSARRYRTELLALLLNWHLVFQDAPQISPRPPSTELRRMPTLPGLAKAMIGHGRDCNLACAGALIAEGLGNDSTTVAKTSVLPSFSGTWWRMYESVIELDHRWSSWEFVSWLRTWIHASRHQNLWSQIGNYLDQVSDLNPDRSREMQRNRYRNMYENLVAKERAMEAIGNAFQGDTTGINSKSDLADRFYDLTEAWWDLARQWLHPWVLCLCPTDGEDGVKVQARLGHSISVGEEQPLPHDTSLLECTCADAQQEFYHHVYDLRLWDQHSPDVQSDSKAGVEPDFNKPTSADTAFFLGEAIKKALQGLRTHTAMMVYIYNLDDEIRIRFKDLQELCMSDSTVSTKSYDDELVGPPRGKDEDFIIF